MNEATRSELIRFARRHKYERDEGFADAPITADVSKGTAELGALVFSDLAEKAGISEEEAESAFLALTMTHFLKAYQSGALERMTFPEFLREKFGPITTP
jgi:hypothetical protein